MMMAGMAFELESQWRPDTSATTARDVEQHRVAMEARNVRHANAGRTMRLGLRDRLAASFRALAGATTAAH